MNCPNGCTDENDRPLDMEFTFSGLHGGKPGYECPNCCTFELQISRGRL